MVRITEGNMTMRLTKKQLEDLVIYNNAMKRTHLGSYNQSQLQSKLSGVSSILGLLSVGITGTAMTVAGAVFTVLSLISDNENDQVKGALEYAEDELLDFFASMTANSNWEQIEVSFAHLVVTESGKGYRVASPGSAITAVRINGNWVN